MDKQQLNSAFDTFNPTDEQKQKMFDNIKQKAYVKIDFKRIYISAAGVAAAAFVFVLGSGMLNNSAPIQPQTQIVQNTEPDILLPIEQPDIAQPEQPTDKIDTSDTAFTAEQTQAESQNNTSSMEQVIESIPDLEQQPVVADQTTTLVLNVNTASVVPNSRMIDAPAALSEQDLHQSLGYEITYEEFCQKAGGDITEAIAVPADMQNITQSESYFNDGEIENWDITYIGEGARSININASLDLKANNEYFENTEFVKTDINGNEAVVFYDGNYSAYMNSENVSYSITGVEITEQEMCDVLVSLAN